ncbi:MAG: hypothetical protein NTV46_11120 [Verrucomicrobia bacterium]|nr:hypothetical protein [Verrucomicrobiota bacterium]
MRQTDGSIRCFVSGITPISPPPSICQGYDRQAGPATGSSNGPQPKSNFLAFDLVVKQVTAWKMKSIYQGDCVFEAK